MKKISNQEAFNRTWTHFVKNEGNKSKSQPGSTCRFKLFGHDGSRDPLGLLIPKKVYRKQMEGKMPRELLREFKPLRNRFSRRVCNNPELLDALQTAHDVAAKSTSRNRDFRRRLQSELKGIAGDFGLRIPA